MKSGGNKNDRKEKVDCDCGIVCGDVCSHVFLCKTDETKPNAERYCEGNSAASRGCQQRQQKRPSIENGSKRGGCYISAWRDAGRRKCG